MNFRLVSGALLVGVMCTITSCLNTKNDTVQVYDDVAITSVKLGTLKYYTTEVNDNGDTTTVTNGFNAAGYPVYIDQLKRHIFNVDSLPIDIDMKRILMESVTTENNAVPFLIKDGKRTQITTATELDLSEPRRILCIATNGVDSVSYTIDLQKHKEYPDTFSWDNGMINSEMSYLIDITSACAGGKVYVMGQKDDVTKLYAANTDGNMQWSALQVKKDGDDVTLSVAAHMVADNDSLYIYDPQSTTLYTTADGTAWNSYSILDDVKAIIAASRGLVYGMSSQKDIMVADQNRKVWYSDVIDDSEYRWTESDPQAHMKSLLPVKDIKTAVYNYGIEDEMSLITLIGNRDVEADTTVVVWNRLIDMDNEDVFAWSYQGFYEGNAYKLPKMTHMSLTSYGSYLIALGDESETIYCSGDHGLTWKTRDGMVLPKNFEAKRKTIVADDKGMLWLIGEETGEIYKGRINKMTWAKPDTYFE